MLGSIKYNLRHLFDFAGRDARQTFWYYVLFLVLLYIAASIAISVPMMVNAVTVGFDSASAELEGRAIETEFAANMAGWIGFSVWAGALVSLAFIALSLAAFVRRLHDSDHSGWWAALPVVSQLIAIGVNISLIDEIQAMTMLMSDPESLDQMMAFQSDMMLYSVIGYIAPLVVVIFGIMKSTDGPNRFGAEPVRF